VARASGLRPCIQQRVLARVGVARVWTRERPTALPLAVGRSQGGQPAGRQRRLAGGSRRGTAGRAMSSVSRCVPASGWQSTGGTAVRRVSGVGLTAGQIQWVAGGTYSAAAGRHMWLSVCRRRWELPNWWCVGSCFSVPVVCMVWPARWGFCGEECLWQRFCRDDSRHDREQRQEHFDDGVYSDSVGVGPAQLESPTALAAAQRHLLATLGEGSLKRPQQAPAPCPFQSHRRQHGTAEPSRPTSLAGTSTSLRSVLRPLPAHPPDFGSPERASSAGRAGAVAGDALLLLRSGLLAALRCRAFGIRHSVGRSGQGATAPADDWTARWGGHFHTAHLYTYFPRELKTKAPLRQLETTEKRLYSTRNKRYL
jgi:hypothetical protein